ncbi:hypothetical protein [Chryseobacterium terrae]|uniref:Leucine Rich repeat-containing protein n=1 Tax=Chryseobacterium terrae TaxID=3163299 RepID=A0ABW8Y795_9FLAO
MKIFDQEISGRNIKTLRFEKETVDFKDVINLEEIERLEIAFCNLVELSEIVYLKKLRQISIYYCRFLSDLSHNGSLSTLKDIVLIRFQKLKLILTSQNYQS